MLYIIRILFIFLIIYFAVKLIFRIIVPAILRWYIKRKMKQSGFDFNENDYKKKNKKEGEIDIEHIPEDNKNKKDKKSGEYTDFEEI